MASAGLEARLAALLIAEGRPAFSESLALAKELAGDRQIPPPAEQQLAACRALARSLPPSLPPASAAQVAALGTGWLAGGNGSADSAQLQAEAARLLVALVGAARGGLQPPAARALLQQACRALRAAPLRPATPTTAAAVELACGCADLLAQLPLWYAQAPKPDLATAVTAVTAVLEQQAAAGGLAEAPATTRLLCKLLRALQALLSEAKKDHGASAASLAPTLQRLFTYGWQPRGGGGSGSGTPKRGAGLAALPLARSAAAAASPSRGVSSSGEPPPPPPGGQASSPGRYRPPHARRSTQGESAAGGGGGGARCSTQSEHGGPPAAQDSSDSESSDVEGGGGERHHAGRVRASALACLQLLAKADPKSLHGSWTALLPLSDAFIASRHGGWGAPGRGAGAASVAHLLLHDPQMRVRHAAAATVTTLLEGPAQRAYLAVAEARELERQPVRGFITLSASLGQMLVALHRALLHSIQTEHDPLVLAASLRALGTLLLGAPYHRLPPALPPLCVRALVGCLAGATPPAGPGALSAEQLPVASACLACLAAVFSSKAAAAAAAEQLLAPPSGAAATGPDRSGGASGEPPSGSGAQLLQLLFAYAACQHPALQLEALMALRGVAQQHAALLQGCWERLLSLGRAGAALPTPPVPQSPRSQQGAADGTVPEKIAQQSVRLPGDYLQAAGEAAEAAAAAQPGMPPDAAAQPDVAQAAGAALAAAAAAQGASEQWQQLADEVLAAAVQHSSALLRAAAHAVVSALSPAAYAALASPLQLQLLAWSCSGVTGDEASPVRAAAAKAVGALAASPALCMLPGGPQQALAALAAGCHDSVLAVRIPAAASLASLCQMLSHAAAAPAAEAGAAAAAVMLPACLQLAVAAAGDSDKVRPSGLQAIGSLFALREALPVEQQGGVSGQQLAAAAEAAQLCLGSGSARVQWAACEAAGQLLACAPPPAQPHWAPLLLRLLALLRGCPNFRSRGLAAAALRRVGGGGAPPPLHSTAALLETAAGVLFEGKPAGFALPAAAPTAQQAQQRAEPSDPGSKAQLEASLVAAVLHLLALLPAAAAGSEGGLAQLASARLAQLQQLVAQAQAEEAFASGEHSAAGGDGLELGQAASGGFDAGMPMFDLSQAPALLVARAAEGLQLLLQQAG